MMRAYFSASTRMNAVTPRGYCSRLRADERYLFLGMAAASNFAVSPYSLLTMTLLTAAVPPGPTRCSCRTRPRRIPRWWNVGQQRETLGRGNSDRAQPALAHEIHQRRMVANERCTLPASRSMFDCPLPLYGTFSMSTLACSLNNSPARCCTLPEPSEAYCSWPGPGFGQGDKLLHGLDRD